MKWQIKFLKNSLIGVLPIGVQQKIRQIKRSFRPYEIEIDETTLGQGLYMIEMLRSSGQDPDGKDYLELGTGWSPVIPLLFWLAGAKSIRLVDEQRLMDQSTFRDTCRKLAAYSDRIAQSLGVPADEVLANLRQVSDSDMDDALDLLRCEYMAPSDMLRNSLPDSSVDIVTSRAVLEHVPPQVVREMFVEFFRILREDGAMCHVIDNSDHWEHVDKSICRLNYLKFSARTFEFISSMNPLDYQNRLRHSQYLKLMQLADFQIVLDESPADPQSLDDLEQLNIHDDFKSFESADLAVLTSNIVAKKVAASTV